MKHNFFFSQEIKRRKLQFIQQTRKNYVLKKWHLGNLTKTLQMMEVYNLSAMIPMVLRKREENIKQLPQKAKKYQQDIMAMSPSKKLKKDVESPIQERRDIMAMSITNTRKARHYGNVSLQES